MALGLGGLVRPPVALRGARWWELVLVALHPVVLPLTTAWRLAGIVRSLAPLAREPWAAFGRLSPFTTLNGAWNRSYDIFRERYGRWGYAYEMGLGTPMGPHFFLTKASMVLYRHAECLFPWAGSVVFLASLTLWAEGGAVTAVVIGLLTVSTLFYVTGFDSLKYDVLGWALVPLGYWAMETGNPWLLAVSFLGIACLSVSVLVVQGAIWLAAAAVVGDWAMMLALVPGAAKFATHFRFLLAPPGLARVRATASGIGLTRAGAERRRLRLHRFDLYLLGLWLLFLAVLALAGGRAPALAAGGAAVALFAINGRVRRFNDVQTLHMAVLAAFTAIALAEPLGWVQVAYWLAVMPVPYVLVATVREGGAAPLWRPAPLALVRTTPIRAVLEGLFAPVRHADRLLFDFDFVPDGYPEFDRTRVIKEYLHFLALEREATIVPDYYLVFQWMGGAFPLEALYADRSAAGRRAALEAIGGRFVLRVAAEPGLGTDWESAGFVLAGEIDLRDGLARGAWDAQCYDAARPFLQLLEARDLRSALAESGEVVEIAPNRLRLRLDAEGRAVVRLVHDPGWRGQGGTHVGRAEGRFPWIAVSGPAGAEVALRYDLFGRETA